MKKVSFYVLGLALLTLALMGLHLKGLYDAAVFEKNRIDQQISSAVCNVFEDISADHSSEVDVRDCANLGNGSFKLIANTNTDQLWNVISQKLDTEDQITFPYHISSELAGVKKDASPSNPKSEDHYQTALVNVDVPPLQKVILMGWGADFILIVLILSLMIWIYYNIIGVLHPGNSHNYTSDIDSIQIGTYTFDFRNQALRNNDIERRITTRECQVLSFLHNRKNQIARRDDILMELWGDNDYFKGRSLDVFIARLRKYLSDDDSIRIETVHGVGFILTEK